MNNISLIAGLTGIALALLPMAKAADAPAKTNKIDTATNKVEVSIFPDKTKKTLGLIYPGKFHFGTDKAERMEIVAGQCSVKVDGESNTNTYATGQVFELPGKSGFDIEVKSGMCEYICTFLT